MSAEERFERDPMFHALVESLCAAIENLELTPTEIREAAMLAALKHEQRRPPNWTHGPYPGAVGDAGDEP